MRRPPTLLVALWATVVELILLAAAGNQWTFDHLIRHAPTSDHARNRALKATLTAFPWRFTPEHDQRMLWLGELVAGVGLIVAVFVLVLAFVAPMHAPRSFDSVFLGTWGLVVALTQVAAVGATMIAYSDISSQDTAHLGRWWFGVFGGPSAATVLFGVVSGLLVAIVAGGVAATTSRDGDEFHEPGVPMPRDEAPAWSAALGSTQAMGVPGERTSSWPPREPETPPWHRSWAPQREPEPERGDGWGGVTESTRITQALPPEPPPPAVPPSEITRPRQPASALPGRPPGSTGRLPLPEDEHPYRMGS